MRAELEAVGTLPSLLIRNVDDDAQLKSIAGSVLSI